MVAKPGDGTASRVADDDARSIGQRWLAGVPVTGERPLSDDERGDLAGFQREIAVAVAKTYGRLLALIAWIIIAQAFELGLLYCWGPVLILLIFVARGGGVRAAAMVRWLRAVRADARDPVVLSASGPLADSFIAVKTLRGPQQLRFFRDEETLAVEVLPQSGMLWSYNGRRTVQPMFVARSRTSLPPEHARMAANFVKPVEGAEGVFSHQRPLDEHEREELRSYLTGVSPLRVGIAVAMLVFGAGLIAVALDSLDFLVIIGGAGLLLIGVARLFNLASRMRLLRLLRNDERESVAVIVREEQEGELGAPVEFLPYSRRIWTRNGVPALWRKISG